LPAPGVSLDEKQAITRQLLRSGAPISAMNVVRKHLSAIKGGRLALAAAPAPVVTLVISDIPGDDPALVASGPTVPDESTCADALALLDRYQVQISAGLRQQLMQGALESAKPRQLPHAAAPVIVASAAQGLRAAQAEAQQAGWQAHILSDAIEGEARDVAAMHAAIARHIARAAQPFAPPCILLSGGEATVTVRGQGKGGRNTEFALALLQALQGEPGIWGGSVGTDGLDGSSGGAGAWIAPSTWQAAQRQGVSAQDHLDRSDSGSFFDRLGLLEHTGPTHTNINDFRALLIEGNP
jgi:hydroxypyruvate reductase